MEKRTMHAIRVYAYGGVDQLMYEQTDRPVPQAGEALVRVLAAGVNPVDWKIRQGLVKEMFPVQFPYIPGGDLAGIVEEVGPGVTTFQKGQAVYGYTTKGVYAEYTLAPISSLALKPETLSFDEAAAVPTGATTAWQGLFEYGKLQAGQRVLIQGAAGGVGGFAVQFAQWKGAQVIGATSSKNVDYVRSLGAEVVDYTTTRVERTIQNIDLVYDAVGEKTVEQSVRVLRRGGTLVSIAAYLPQELLQERNVHGATFLAQISSELLETIAHLIDEGSAKVEVAAIFALSDVRRAHELSQQGHGRGRIVLHIAD
ncbi:MAG: NADP-dependent oxidoreductase [Roseiflexaceae bacterium]